MFFSPIRRDGFEAHWRCLVYLGASDIDHRSSDSDRPLAIISPTRKPPFFRPCETLPLISGWGCGSCMDYTLLGRGPLHNLPFLPSLRLNHLVLPQQYWRPVLPTTTSSKRLQMEGEKSSNELRSGIKYITSRRTKRKVLFAASLPPPNPRLIPADCR